MYVYVSMAEMSEETCMCPYCKNVVDHFIRNGNFWYKCPKCNKSIRSSMLPDNCKANAVNEEEPRQEEDVIEEPKIEEDVENIVKKRREETREELPIDIGSPRQPWQILQQVLTAWQLPSKLIDFLVARSRSSGVALHPSELMDLLTTSYNSPLQKNEKAANLIVQDYIRALEEEKNKARVQASYNWYSYDYTPATDYGYYQPRMPKEEGAPYPQYPQYPGRPPMYPPPPQPYDIRSIIEDMERRHREEMEKLRQEYEEKEEKRREEERLRKLEESVAQTKDFLLEQLNLAMEQIKNELKERSSSSPEKDVIVMKLEEMEKKVTMLQNQLSEKEKEELKNEIAALRQMVSRPQVEGLSDEATVVSEAIRGFTDVLKTKEPLKNIAEIVKNRGVPSPPNPSKNLSQYIPEEFKE